MFLCCLFRRVPRFDSQADVTQDLAASVSTELRKVELIGMIARWHAPHVQRKIDRSSQTNVGWTFLMEELVYCCSWQNALGERDAWRSPLRAERGVHGHWNSFCSCNLRVGS